MSISDEKLDKLGEYFIRMRYREKYGWTFHYFLDMIERNTYEERMRGR